MIFRKLFFALALSVSAGLLAGCDTGSQGETSQPANGNANGIDTKDMSAAVKMGKPPEEMPDPVVEASTSKGSKPAGSTAAPGASLPKNGEQIAVMETSKGRIVLKFFPKEAPETVKNFVKLSKEGFYDGTKFHRVVPGFMIQGGDPNTRTGQGTPGTGGPGYTINAEFNPIKHKRGILSMARSMDVNSAGSQFFIMHADSPSLDNQYTAFGQVVEGMDTVDSIVSVPTNGETVINMDEVVLKSLKITKWPLK